MAKQELKYKENVPGNFFVDSTCIDCGTCYWVAPDVFQRHEGHSIVYHQPKPDDSEEQLASYRALYSCPTQSIGVEQLSKEGKEALESFPYPISQDVFHTGFHSENSFGAASYLIKDGDDAILIDSPRFNKKLVDKIKAMGGLKYQVLSHIDDIADTDKFHDVFQSPRFIHECDSGEKAAHYEHFFKGEDPFQITDQLLAIPVPGHTEGSVVFLFKNKYLFTGDHLAFSPSLGHLYAFRRACWYDFETQIQSMKKLLQYEFQYVLPGHGFPYQATADEMKASLKKCIEWMKSAL